MKGRSSLPPCLAIALLAAGGATISAMPAVAAQVAGGAAPAGAAAAAPAPSASAQPGEAPAPARAGMPSRVVRGAGTIATQPARDVGLDKSAIPDALQQAIADPYAAVDTRSCRATLAALDRLNAALGPDFVAGATRNEDRASRIAEAGGRTVVNSLIPFRGLIREVSGAAPAQRRLNAAIDAGYARRGFLRGIAQAKGCRLSKETAGETDGADTKAGGGTGA